MTEIGYDIYGDKLPEMKNVLQDLETHISSIRDTLTDENGMDPIEHFLARIKSDESMREKCIRKGLPESPYSALRVLKDSIGLRIVTAFRDDIKNIVEKIRSMKGVEIVEEIDYIRHAKSNGYRCYHMVLLVTSPYPDIDGNKEGK